MCGTHRYQAILSLGMNCPEWCINIYNKTKKTCNLTTITFIFIIFSLHRSQQKFKETPFEFEFIFQVVSSLPKRALSSTQVAGQQNRERKKQAGMWANTQICVGVGNWAARVQTYSRNPLCSQGNSKGNPASPPLCPAPDPFTSLVVAVVACKKKGKEDGLTLLDLITFLQTLVIFSALEGSGNRTGGYSKKILEDR